MPLFTNRLQSNRRASYGLPFNLARFFSVIFLILMLTGTVALAFFMNQSNMSILLETQKKSGLVLAENLNRQMFRDYLSIREGAKFGAIAVPPDVNFDEINNNNINKIIQSAIDGFHVQSVKIYNQDFVVSFSSDITEAGQVNTDSIPHLPAFKAQTPLIEVLPAVPGLLALLLPDFGETQFQLKISYPLTAEPNILKALMNLRPRYHDATAGNMAQSPLNLYFDELWGTSSPQASRTNFFGLAVLGYGDILGILEVTQDITSDLQEAMRSQRIFILGFLISCAILFVLIQIMARQAQRILAERVQRNLELEMSLHQNEKLASMGRMVSSIAHEIRNPLGIIRSSSEFLLKRTNGADPSSLAILEAIYNESCRLGVTVTEFLDYARPKQIKSEPLELVGVVEKAIAFLAGEFAKQRIAVYLDYAGRVTILGDQDLLYRAVYNILVNAEQAIGEKGRIDIQISDHKNFVNMTVHDSGPGFSEADFTRPMDPFYTTKDTGTGLGLAIVHSIITGHGGKVSLSNHPEGGAVCQLDMPKGK